jgi:ribosome-associated protein
MVSKKQQAEDEWIDDKLGDDFDETFDDDDGVTVIWEVPNHHTSARSDPNAPLPEKEYAVRPNKTQLKRETEAIQALVLTLLKQDQASLARLPLTEKLLTALSSAKKLQKSALKRQIKYLTSLLRDQGADFIDDVRQALAAQQIPHQQQVAQFHQLETWRDQLLAGDRDCLQALHERYHDFDIQYVRQLTRNAKKEQQQQKPPKSSRALFQYLKGLAD